MSSKQDKNFEIRPVYSVDSVEVLKSANEEILLKTISTAPNPCYEFSHIDLDETNIASNEIWVTVFAKKDKSVNCISVIGKMEAEFTLIVPKTGAYKVVFKGKTKNLEKYIEVK
ncbi:MAG: hypothetical protein D8M58_21245 [Calditrichaeota bacterium]|nr:MAG: hypothetical protein DWQ03_16960 [Calditrichota bacterium]MBL1207939.1 hypothetical protein [Calditrichota bacterium]